MTKKSFKVIESVDSIKNVTKDQNYETSIYKI